MTLFVNDVVQVADQRLDPHQVATALMIGRPVGPADHHVRENADEFRVLASDLVVQDPDAGS